MNRYAPRPHQPSEKALRSVYVGNIGYDVTEEELANIFSKVGHVISFRLVHDRETGKSKGFGFCEFPDQMMANNCIRMMNGYELKGRNLRLDSAVANERMMPVDDFHPMQPLPHQQQQQHAPRPLLQPQPQSSAMPPHSEASNVNPYGIAPINGDTPEAIAKSLSNLSPELMFKVIQEMKHLAQTNPKKCRTKLDTNPQLAFALLQAQVMMHWVNTDTAFNLLDRNMSQEKMAERAEIATRDEERPSAPGIVSQPAFRPPPPQQTQPEHQFFNMEPTGMYRPPFRSQMPSQQAPPRPGIWNGPPNPQQRFGGPPAPFRGSAPYSNPPQEFQDNFRNYGNRPNMPPPSFQGPRPPFGQPLLPQKDAFRSIRPPTSQQLQQRQSEPQRKEADNEDDMIQQLLTLTEDQISQLNPDEQLKVRQLREQLGVGR